MVYRPGPAERRIMMDSIAIISDIHGNLPALLAVLADIETKDVSKILCLGDMIGKGPSSPEAVDICRERCAAVIAGNWDKYMAKTSKRSESITYYINQLGEGRLAYLRDLPEFIEFYLSGKLVRLFHAHPLDVFKRVHPTSELREREGMFTQPAVEGDRKHSGRSDIAGYGDIHWAYIQNIQGRILFNVGSVGNPLDMTMASYVILEGEMDSQVPAPFATHFCRVPYDIELALRQAEEKSIPQLEAYVSELRTAVYVRR